MSRLTLALGAFVNKSAINVSSKRAQTTPHQPLNQMVSPSVCPLRDSAFFNTVLTGGLIGRAQLSSSSNAAIDPVSV